MDIFNASAMGMLFTQVPFDKLLGGAVEQVEDVQYGIAEKLGSIIGTAGGFTPALQQMMTNTMTVRYPEAVKHLVQASNFLRSGNQTLAQLRQIGGKLGPHAIHVASASQIAASTTSAFITMCHVVASYDNAVKLQEANAKLDQLLQDHNREYRANLEAIYNQLGDLLLKHACGFSMIAELGNRSQDLDKLVIIWLDQIFHQLQPVKTATTWTGFLAGMQHNNIYAALLVGIPWAILCSGPTTAAARWCYVKWVKDLCTRLDKVNRLTRLVAIAIWLRHVVSHHTASAQPLYHKYGNRLENIGIMAGSIKNAVEENRKLINIDGQLTRQLEWEETLPSRIRAMLQTPTVVSPQTDKLEAKLGVYFDRDTRSFCLTKEGDGVQQTKAGVEEGDTDMPALPADVASLVQEVFGKVVGADAVTAVLRYLRTQRFTSLADLQYLQLDWLRTALEPQGLPPWLLKRFLDLATKEDNASIPVAK